MAAAAAPKLPSCPPLWRWFPHGPPKKTNGWRRAYWLFQPRRSLSRQVLAFRPEDPPTEPEAAANYLLYYANPTFEEKMARTPAEMFGEAPDAVMILARADAADAADAGF